MNEFKVGADPQGNLVIQIGDKNAAICPRDALRVAATICGLMMNHFPPPQPQPQLAVPDKRIVLPCGPPCPVATAP